MTHKMTAPVTADNSLDALLHPFPGLGAARAALQFARAAEAKAAAVVQDQDSFTAAVDNAVLGYGLLFGPLLVRDPDTVSYTVRGTSVTAEVDPPDSILSAQVILDSVLTAWCAADFEAAARFGSVPTQRFKTKLDDRDRTRLMAVFAVVSIARGNIPAFQRAEANALDADASGQTLDATVSRGGIIPLLNALSAIQSGKRRVAERALNKLVRYHGWNTRENPDLAGFDRWSTAVVRFAHHKGMAVQVLSPAVPSWLAATT